MHSGGQAVSHFARKVLGPKPQNGFSTGGIVENSAPYIVGEDPCGCHLGGARHYQIDSRGSSDPKAVEAAVKRAIQASHASADRVPEPARTITLPRLWVWVPSRSAEDIKAGRAGWLPAAIAGTDWDAQQWRTQYKARHMCTLWIKAGLGNAT